MNQLELRMNPTEISTEDGKMYVEGLVNGTETWSKEMGIKRKFVEKIKKGAFTRALNTAPRIDFLAEHDTTKLLATTDNGSLELFEDSEGLKMRAEIVPTSYGKDMYELMKSGMVRHMSFGFKALKDKWEKRSTGLYERTIEELALAEVSVVRNPAYAMSGISARNIDILEDVEIPSEVDEVKEEVMEEVIKEEVVVEESPIEATEEIVEEKEEKVEEEVVAEASDEVVCEETNKEEQRAYFMPIHSKNEAVNRCLDIVAQSTELIAYANEHGSDNAVVSQLEATIKSVTDFMISLNAIAQKEETVGEIVAEVVEEIVDALVEGRSVEEEVEAVEVAETTEVTEEKEEIKDEEIAEEVVEEEEVSENIDTENAEIGEEKEQPSVDLSKYRNKIKEELVL